MPGPIIAALARIVGPRLTAAVGTIARKASTAVPSMMRSAEGAMRRRAPNLWRKAVGQDTPKLRPASVADLKAANLTDLLSGKVTMPELQAQNKAAFEEYAQGREQKAGVSRTPWPKLAKDNMGDLMAGKTTREKLEDDDMQRVEGQAQQNEYLEKFQESLKRSAFTAFKFTAVTAGAMEAMKRFAAATLEGQRQFAKFNGYIGRSFARLERDRIIRARESGGARAGSTERLAASVSAMEAAWRPIGDMVANVLNRFAAVFADIVAPIGSILGSLVKILSPILSVIGGVILSLLQSLALVLNVIAMALKPIAWLMEKLVWLLDKILRFLTLGMVGLPIDKPRPAVTQWEAGIGQWAAAAVGRKMPPLGRPWPKGAP